MEATNTPVLVLTLFAATMAGCLESADSDEGQQASSWNSSLALGVTNVGEHEIKVTLHVTAMSNDTRLLEYDDDIFAAGEQREWELNLKRQNYTVHIRAWSESRQEYNPNTANMSASGGLTFDAAECPRGSPTIHKAEVKYEDSGFPLIGPYVTESVNVSGTTQLCA